MIACDTQDDPEVGDAGAREGGIEVPDGSAAGGGPSPDGGVPDAGPEILEPDAGSGPARSYAEQLAAGKAPLFSESVHGCDGARELCDVSAAAGISGLARYGRGIAVADVDGDAFDDVMIVDSDGRFAAGWGISRLYRNLGDGTFEVLQDAIDEDALHSTWTVTFGDIDNDGDPDLLIVNGGFTGEGYLWLMENRMADEGRFVDISASAGLDAANRLPGGQPQPHSWWGASFFDYDGDGLLDAVVTRRHGQPVLLHNLGDRRFEEVSEALGLRHPVPDPGQVKNAVPFDHDGDGDLDLYLAGFDVHGFFENRVSGGEGFVEVTAALLDPILPAEAPSLFSAAAADFDQDGHDDLYLGRWNRQDYLLRNLGDGTFEALGTEIGIDGSLADSPDGMDPFENTMGLGVGDLFDDGFPDVLIGTGRPDFGFPDIAFCNDGMGGFTRCSELFELPGDPAPRTRGHGVVFFDIDRDGDTDVLRNLGGHPVYDFEQNLAREMDGLPPDVDTRDEARLWAQNGSRSDTAALTLVGTQSNRDAIGARVTLRAPRVHHYCVRPQQGFQSQNSPTLILPLGAAESLEVLIEWPSGQMSTVFVERGQHHRVVEASPAP